MDQNISSEEKLLRLIRKRDKGRKTSASLKESQPKENSTAEDSSVSKKEGADFLKLINNLFILILLGILGYILAQTVFAKKESMDSSMVAENVAMKKSSVSRASASEMKPFDDYQAKFEQKDIFISPWDRARQKPGNLKKISSDLTRQLKLVGIVLDENPQAIVEDIKERQTYFLSEGESIREAELMEIHEDKVIFNYNEETIELTP